LFSIFKEAKLQLEEIMEFLNEELKGANILLLVFILTFSCSNKVSRFLHEKFSIISSLLANLKSMFDLDNKIFSASVNKLTIKIYFLFLILKNFYIYFF